MKDLRDLDLFSLLLLSLYFPTMYEYAYSMHTRYLVIWSYAYCPKAVSKIILGMTDKQTDRLTKPFFFFFSPAATTTATLCISRRPLLLDLYSLTSFVPSC